MPALPSGGWIEPDTHAENPLTKRRFKNLMDASGLSAELPGYPAAHGDEEVCRAFNTREYVDHIKALSDDNGGDAGCVRRSGRARTRSRCSRPAA